ncbi:XRE family transcriptional regulator [Kutzneria albida]|uniref:XRE family transcriptional regulator n=1 Tax=Kutzneria albida DSM 43870 TaxID=1449976 RepID=W5WLR9_9PSEU|nr:XRE family transcriptional regulator [Kutzneria albida]AHI01711.1 hypothetical protein KALB_8354 [Kutzneria albida DSM 43870]
MATLAERLNTLFATVVQVDAHGRRREYSTPHVARTISEDPAHDTTVSRVYLATLRSGANTNPTIAVIRALAKFFDEHRAPGTPHITAAYLLGDEPEDAEERELRAKLADRHVRMIAMRAGDMTPAVRKQVLKMIDVLLAEDEEQQP